MNGQTIIEQEKKTANFLKEAFCIDGECIFYKEVMVDFKLSIMYKLTDSKRGIFYITITA